MKKNYREISGSLLKNTQSLHREADAGEKAVGSSTMHTTLVDRENMRPRKTTTIKTTFMPGDRFIAPIKMVHAEGVYVQMPGNKGSGVISPRCWGMGAQRQAALSMLHPGIRVAVLVRQYHEPTRTASLVLDGDGTVPDETDSLPVPLPSVARPTPSVAKSASLNGAPAAKFRKTEFQPIAAGTTLLLDCANLFGVVGPEHAAYKLQTIGDALRSSGYGVAFFMEYRTKSWCLAHQPSPADADALKAFCEESNVMLVEGQADLAILQIARVLPDTVCCSRDHFQDYASMFGDIVGYPRRRPFECILIGGKELLCIDGLAEAIVLEPPPGEMQNGNRPERATRTVPKTPVEAVEERLDEPEVDESEVAALVRRVRRMLEKGETERCERYIGRMVSTRAEGYRAMAEIYEAGIGGCVSAKNAKKYRRLAERDERRQRQCERRRVRLYAQWVQSGHKGVLRMSSGKRMEMDLRRNAREKVMRLRRVA